MTDLGLPNDFVSLLVAMSPKQRAGALNQFLSGLDRLLGIEFTAVSETSVHARCLVAKHHLQVFGLVHGGVYASLAETCCSTGAAISVLTEQRNVVGRSNYTEFRKAARENETLLIHAQFQERTSEKELSWNCRIYNEADVEFARSAVVLNVLEPNHVVGGDTLSVLGTENLNIETPDE